MEYFSLTMLVEKVDRHSKYVSRFIFRNNWSVADVIFGHYISSDGILLSVIVRDEARQKKRK
jgi:hypothetical protein